MYCLRCGPECSEKDRMTKFCLCFLSFPPPFLFVRIILPQPRSQGLLRFQDGHLRFQDGHLESGVHPGNEVDSPAEIWDSPQASEMEHSSLFRTKWRKEVYFEALRYTAKELIYLAPDPEPKSVKLQERNGRDFASDSSSIDTTGKVKS